jgi:hypothetical protein
VGKVMVIGERLEVRGIKKKQPAERQAAKKSIR